MSKGTRVSNVRDLIWRFWSHSCFTYRWGIFFPNKHFQKSIKFVFTLFGLWRYWVVIVFRDTPLCDVWRKVEEEWRSFVCHELLVRESGFVACQTTFSKSNNCDNCLSATINQHYVIKIAWPSLWCLWSTRCIVIQRHEGKDERENMKNVCSIISEKLAFLRLRFSCGRRWFHVLFAWILKNLISRVFKIISWMIKSIKYWKHFFAIQKFMVEGRPGGYLIIEARHITSIFEIYSGVVVSLKYGRLGIQTWTSTEKRSLPT